MIISEAFACKHTYLNLFIPKVQDAYSVHPIFSILQGKQLELQSGRTRSDRPRQIFAWANKNYSFYLQAHFMWRWKCCMLWHRCIDAVNIVYQIVSYLTAVSSCIPGNIEYMGWPEYASGTFGLSLCFLACLQQYRIFQYSLAQPLCPSMTISS